MMSCHNRVEKFKGGTLLLFLQNDKNKSGVFDRYLLAEERPSLKLFQDFSNPRNIPLLIKRRQC